MSARDAEARLDDLLSDLQEEAQERFPDTFTSLLCLRGPAPVVVLHRTRAGDLDTWFRDRVGTAAVVHIRTSRYPFRTLAETAHEIATDGPTWAAAGVRLRAVRPITDGSAVYVGVVPADLHRAVAAFEDRYGELAYVHPDDDSLLLQ